MKIIFDVDDTIYNLMQPFFEAHNEIYGSRTDADCEQLFMASRIYSDEAFYMHERGEITAAEEFAYRIRKTYADVGIQVSDQEAAFFEERYRYYQQHIQKDFYNFLLKYLSRLLLICYKLLLALNLSVLLY